jgi:hypothetical protein
MGWWLLFGTVHVTKISQKQQGVFMKSLLVSVLTLVSFSAMAHQHCATVYNSFDPALRTGMSLCSGQSIRNLETVSMGHHTSWDNKITQVDVAPGCTFIGYQYQNFNIDYSSGAQLAGFTAVIDNNDLYNVRSENLQNYYGYDNKISSLSCYCR